VSDHQRAGLSAIVAWVKVALACDGTVVIVEPTINLAEHRC
jgi:hypothetical protein